MAIQSLTGSGNAPAPNPQPARGAEAGAAPGQAAPAQPGQSREPSLEEVKRATQQVQQVVQAKVSNLQFAIAQDQGQTIVRLMDKLSGEVILQIPSKAMVAIADQIDKTVGMFVRQKV